MLSSSTRKSIFATCTESSAIVVDNATAPEPSKLTALAVTSPVKEKFCAEAKAVAVAALPVVEPELPVTFPVTLPVTLPSRFAINVPVVCPVPLISTVVEGSAWLP